ncbi:MAG: BrnT family toxin [Blastocatellia bacterium]
MQIDRIVCPARIEEKLASKHRVSVEEACQILENHHRLRFAEKGDVPGDDVYAAFGQTLGGRYLVVFFIYKPTNKTAIIISARDMNERERKSYGRK